MKTRERLRALQRELYDANERRIAEVVATPRRFDRVDLDRYERELTDSIPDAWEPSSPAALRAAIRRATVILVGDYHTLRQAQRGFLRVLRAIRSRKLLIALEFVCARHQAAVDAFVAGRIDDPVFLRRIRYSRSWPSYHVWPNFRPIFEFARLHKSRVVGLDCEPSECGSVFSRAGFAAWRIAEALREHPDHRVAVLMGENHLAPGHLPAQLRDALDRIGVPARILVIHQNLDKVYFQLVDRGMENRVDVVHLSGERWVVPVSSPITAQQSFLDAVAGESWCGEDLDDTTVRRTFARTLQRLGEALGLRTSGVLRDVSVCGPEDLDRVVRLCLGFGDLPWRMVAESVAERESLCLPEQGLVYLASLSPTHVAEEAAHFLKARLAGGPVPEDPVDFFYSRVLHEAIGYLGSKVFNPKRKPPSVPMLARDALDSLDASGGGADRAFAALLTVWHRKAMKRKGFGRESLDAYVRSLGIAEGLQDLGPEVIRPMVHHLGYELGERLDCAFRDGAMSAADVRRLFRRNFEDPGGAFRIWEKLRETLKGVKVPERF
jgi:hypothetical protein